MVSICRFESSITIKKNEEMKNLELLESLLVERQCKLDLLNFETLRIPIFHVDHKIWSMRPVKLSKYFEHLYKSSNVEELWSVVYFKLKSETFSYPNLYFEDSDMKLGLFEKYFMMLPTLHEYILLKRRVDNCHRKIGVLKKSL
jgi:hypothetical protein